MGDIHMRAHTRTCTRDEPHSRLGVGVSDATPQAVTRCVGKPGWGRVGVCWGIGTTGRPKANGHLTGVSNMEHEMTERIAVALEKIAAAMDGEDDTSALCRMAAQLNIVAFRLDDIEDAIRDAAG